MFFQFLTVPQGRVLPKIQNVAKCQKISFFLYFTLCFYPCSFSVIPPRTNRPRWCATTVCLCYLQGFSLRFFILFSSCHYLFSFLVLMLYFFPKIRSKDVYFTYFKNQWHNICYLAKPRENYFNLTKCSYFYKIRDKLSDYCSTPQSSAQL